jgi:putative glutamine amidotransferase
MASLYRPTIGLTTQTLHSIDGIPPALPSSWVMNQRYFVAATSVGAVPWMIPLLDDDLFTLREIYERLDGLLIPGGVDINPAEYGEAVRPECGNLDPARDRVELQLVRWAIEDGKPVLGLCRGHQIINVAQGGTMWSVSSRARGCHVCSNPHGVRSTACIIRGSRPWGAIWWYRRPPTTD